LSVLIPFSVFFSGGCPGRDRMDLQSPVQSVPNTTNFVSSNPAQARYMW